MINQNYCWNENYMVHLGCMDKKLSVFGTVSNFLVQTGRNN